ncbi:ceramide transfer protein-like [Glossina fuscipes fuscipes]
MYTEDNASTTDTTSLKRHGSNVSLQSTTISVASGGSLKRTQYNLNEKIDEIETFKKILFGQIETLQRYFDVCAETNKAPGKSFDFGFDLTSTDFKGESITFRATTTGVLNTLQHCLEIISERGLTWKRKLEREIEKRKKLEEQIRKYKLEIEKFKNISYPGPDFEEGPHSPLPEDEFFVAVETGLDKIEEDMQLRAKLKLQTQLSQISVHSYTALGLNQPVDDNLVDDDDKEFGTGSLASGHSLWPEIDRVCEEQLQSINLSNP